MSLNLSLTNLRNYKLRVLERNAGFENFGGFKVWENNLRGFGRKGFLEPKIKRMRISGA